MKILFEEVEALRVETSHYYIKGKVRPNSVLRPGARFRTIFRQERIETYEVQLRVDQLEPCDLRRVQ